MNSLYDTLVSYSQTDFYPYHMPGHKRNVSGAGMEGILRTDITEIEGFDNLHQPQGILKEMQEKASVLYGADESFLLVNGSTCGILSAISCALPEGGHLLMARNCHKAVYHGAYLRNLTISYLYPDVLVEYDICEAIDSEQVRLALEHEPDIQAVLIVSPTYEGRIADIGAVAEVVHARGIPLIVDEAHGAHLGFTGAFSQGSCRQGADIVIHSVHKTLTSMTQTAILHVNGKLIDRKRLKRFLSIYQSSSPSYVLMASIGECLKLLEEDGESRLERLSDRFAQMVRELGDLKQISILPPAPDQDIGKLLISVKKTCLSGQQLYDILLQEYHLQMEMTADSFVLAMFTIGDTEEGFSRLTRALLEIDLRLQEEKTVNSNGKQSDWHPDWDRHKNICSPLPIELSKAWDTPSEECGLAESVGKTAGDFVNLYPPGIPILVPGETISGEIAAQIKNLLDQGLNVQGTRRLNDRYVITVLTE